MSRPRKTLIHVNQHIIRRNQKTGERLSPITVRQGRTIRRSSSVEILGENGQPVARVIYSHDDPLACGARVWIETLHNVSVRDQQSK